MAYQQTRGVKRIFNAFRYSMEGFRQCFMHEEAFRQEIFASVVIVPLGIWLGASGVERALLVGSWITVLIVELVNSALEAVVDRVGLDHHELSGRAKDIASAAVFTSLVFSLLVWALVLTPRWFAPVS